VFVALFCYMIRELDTLPRLSAVKMGYGACMLGNVSPLARECLSFFGCKKSLVTAWDIALLHHGGEQEQVSKK
jgi:hypothetical protein